MNQLSISSSSSNSGKNGYPSYQATVASISSPSVANSTGAVTAMLNSVNLGGGLESSSSSASLKERIKSPSSSKLAGAEAFLSSSSSSSMTNQQQPNRLDNFDFMTTVGTGTFGRVIVVRERHTKQFYALKIMSIAEVLRLKQTEHVKNEKEILMQINHPFIINL